MSTVLRLPGAPDLRLARPLWPDGGRRPAWRRRGALGLVLLALAVPALLIETGTTGPSRAGSVTTAAGGRAPPRAAATEPRFASAQAQPHGQEGRLASDRIVAPRHATALFAQHSWFVLPPPPPPAPPPPPPQPTAPPFPYTFVGSYAPGGDPPVFFLSRGDRVVDAHVGDLLDGVYRFESAAGGQLVFVYLPLDTRQSLAAGGSR